MSEDCIILATSENLMSCSILWHLIMVFIIKSVFLSVSNQEKIQTVEKKQLNPHLQIFIKIVFVNTDIKQ